MQWGSHDLREHEVAGAQVIAGCGRRDLSGQSIGCVLHRLGGALGVLGTDYSSGCHKSYLLNNHSYWGLCAPQWGSAPERRAACVPLSEMALEISVVS